MFIICEVCVDWVSVRIFSCVYVRTFHFALCRALCEAPGCWRLISFTFPCECLCVSWQNSSPHGNSLGVGALNGSFVFAFPCCVNRVLVSRADNCWSDSRLCCFPVLAAGLCHLSRRPNTDANSSWQTLKHTSNTPMVKYVKLLTALTARREKKYNRICRHFSLFCFQIIWNMLEDWRCPRVFLKALGFEVVILPSANRLMGSYEIFTQCEVQPKCKYFMLNLSN